MSLGLRSQQPKGLVEWGTITTGRQNEPVFEHSIALLCGSLGAIFSQACNQDTYSDNHISPLSGVKQTIQVRAVLGNTGHMVAFLSEQTNGQEPEQESG